MVSSHLLSVEVINDSYKMEGLEKQKAFTLIELIVVIAIIAILAAVVAPNAFRAVEKSKIARLVRDTKTIKSAAYNMYADTGLWPGSNWNDENNDPLQGADPGEGFVFRGDDLDMPNSWDGPYIEKWPLNPWGGFYWWDYNDADQNGDGIGREHVLWIDNALNNTGRRIPNSARKKIDETLDDGNFTNGTVQVWQVTNFGYILIQGQ
ncbi:MAG: prepilin-type N-terminal cleavage/methylation domain-containing protein [Candidatus Omnitrophica bacterium]|nr:prepilin-type N-terminal cleavage/methylation domain-containing protein [Candidatus Omnitrophota bacterium]